MQQGTLTWKEKVYASFGIFAKLYSWQCYKIKTRMSNEYRNLSFVHAYEMYLWCRKRWGCTLFSFRLYHEESNETSRRKKREEEKSSETGEQSQFRKKKKKKKRKKLSGSPSSVRMKQTRSWDSRGGWRAHSQGGTDLSPDTAIANPSRYVRGRRRLYQ